MSFSALRELPVREKIFDPRHANSRRQHHTMTDNHTLFMLFQNKERVAKGERPIRAPWYTRLLK